MKYCIYSIIKIDSYLYHREAGFYLLWIMSPWIKWNGSQLEKSRKGIAVERIFKCMLTRLHNTAQPTQLFNSHAISFLRKLFREEHESVEGCSLPNSLTENVWVGNKRKVMLLTVQVLCAGINPGYVNVNTITFANPRIKIKVANKYYILRADERLIKVKP